MATASIEKSKKKLPERLAQVRADRSQRQFARELGVFQQNVNRYENGTTLHADFLITLAMKENISLDWLLLGILGNIATAEPELWATREPLDGFAIEPGEQVAVGLRLAPDPGVEAATIDREDITYRVQGELFDRTATSQLTLAIATDCDALLDA